MISYAQNLEDVLLARVFRDQIQGHYVDIGANHPVKLSITKHFYDLGWQGINVEPGQIYQELAAARQRDINLNLAISNETGERMFYEYPVGNALSSFSSELPDTDAHWLEGRIERKVETLTLREMFEKYQPPTIDFMNVDVEGHQHEVLEGNDWTRWRPRVVLAEATDPTKRDAYNHGGWEAILFQASYKPVHFDGLNRYYLREEDSPLAERFHAPANVLDNFIPAHVMELRRDMRRQTTALSDSALRLAQAKSLLEVARHRISQDRDLFQREKLQKQQLNQELKEAREKLRHRREAEQKRKQVLENYQKRQTQLAQRNENLSQQLMAQIEELEQIHRDVDQHSLQFGLRIARFVQRLKSWPASLWGKRAA